MVNQILSHKLVQRKGKPQYLYLVSWVGFPPEHNEWLTESDFSQDGTYENTNLNEYKEDNELFAEIPELSSVLGKRKQKRT
jgi:hypothetical protein